MRAANASARDLQDIIKMTVWLLLDRSESHTEIIELQFREPFCPVLFQRVLGIDVFQSLLITKYSLRGCQTVSMQYLFRFHFCSLIARQSTRLNISNFYQSLSNTFYGAQSKWRYPQSKAVFTTLATSLGPDLSVTRGCTVGSTFKLPKRQCCALPAALCSGNLHGPSPTDGIVIPLLSFIEVITVILS